MEYPDEFFNTYRKYVRTVSKLAQKARGFYEEDTLDADICWQVSDNMEILLSEGKLGDYRNITNSEEVVTILTQFLVQGKLLIIFQDTVRGGWDHWFALIGSGGRSYIIEYLPGTCNVVEEWDTEELAEYFAKVVGGSLPDRFYGNQEPHKLSIWVNHRKPMTADTVLELVYQDDSFAE